VSLKQRTTQTYTLAGTAVRLVGELLNKQRRVTRHQQDNLPAHVKGQAYFEDNSLTGIFNPNTGYYIDKPNNKHVAVEFINVQEEDQ